MKVSDNISKKQQEELWKDGDQYDADYRNLSPGDTLSDSADIQITVDSSDGATAV